MWAIVGLACPAHAFAQVGKPWLSDRPETQGIGIRTENLEFHPGVAGEIGYDSNYFQASGDQTGDLNEPIIPTLRMRLTPSLSLQTLGAERSKAGGAEAAPPKVRFGATGSLSLDKLVSLDDAYADRVAGEAYLSGSVDASLNVSPDRPLGADFVAGFARVTQPFNTPGVLTFNHKVYHGGADLRWRPGGGLLEWNLGYGARGTTFDQVDYGLNNVEHGARTRGLWRFLPKTGLIYQGEVQFVKRLYTSTRLRDSTTVASQLGLNGLITSKLGALVMGGWRAGFYGAGSSGIVEDLDTPIGRAELTWFISGNAALEGSTNRGFSTLKLGYFRDGYASELSNYYVVDKGYLELSMLIGSSVYIAAGAGMSNVQHSLPRQNDGSPLTTPPLREYRPEAALFAQWRLLSTFALFINSGYSASPRNNVLSNGDGRGEDSMKYSRLTAMLGARWFL
jgi:hypothetical protein